MELAYHVILYIRLSLALLLVSFALFAHSFHPSINPFGWFDLFFVFSSWFFSSLSFLSPFLLILCINHLQSTYAYIDQLTLVLPSLASFTFPCFGCWFDRSSFLCSCFHPPLNQSVNPSIHPFIHPSVNHLVDLRPVVCVLSVSLLFSFYIFTLPSWKLLSRASTHWWCM